MLLAQVVAAPIMTAPRPVAVPAPLITVADPTPARRERFDVVVRSPAGVLWTGWFLVAERGQSSWTQSRSEPLEAACGTRAYGGEREALNISLMASYGPEPDVSRIVVNARWSRLADEPCAGLRTVELRQTIAVPDKGVATVRGDGGLLVELRRR